eukprot:Gb_04012 [translate_table: standard]
MKAMKRYTYYGISNEASCEAYVAKERMRIPQGTVTFVRQFGRMGYRVLYYVKNLMPTRWSVWPTTSAFGFFFTGHGDLYAMFSSLSQVIVAFPLFIPPQPRLFLELMVCWGLKANVTSTELLKQRKKEESKIQHKEKKLKCKLECIGKKIHVEEALTHVEPSLNQVLPIEDQLQREMSNVQMGKKKRLLKRVGDSQETKGEMKS